MDRIYEFGNKSFGERLYKRILVLFFCLAFFSGCIDSLDPTEDSASLASHQGDEEPLPEDISPQEELSREQLVDNQIDLLQGIYRGTHQTDRFEVWIEKVGQSEKGVPIIAVLLFLQDEKQDKKEDIQQFFTKYQDIDSYYNDMCTSFTYPMLTENNKTDSIAKRGAENIWKSMGALGKAHLTLENSYTFEDTYFDIAFQDQQYGLSSLHISPHSGEAQSVTLWSRNIKQQIADWWYESSTRIQLKKTSSPKTDFLNKYYQTVEAIEQTFQEERVKYRYYCPNFVSYDEEE